VRQCTRIAVFGRADIGPETQDYWDASELGTLIAREGWVTLTGGYGGAMEAACRGALGAGGETEGVLCSLFSNRRPNAFLTREVWASDLWQRTRLLVEQADAYVALAPRAGTLAEVANLWALRKAGHMPMRPLVVVGPAWGEVLGCLARTGALDENLLKWTVCVRGSRPAVGILREALREGSIDGKGQG
jgi:hypothetical protein